MHQRASLLFFSHLHTASPPMSKGCLETVLLSLQNRKCLRHRLLSRRTMHFVLAGEKLRNRQGESQFPQTEAKSHEFRYFFRFDCGEFLWKTVGAFVERRMIRLTNQSKIERNFTFPGYAGGSPKAKFRSGGTSPVGSGTQTLVDRPRWPDWGCTEQSKDSILCFVFPTAPSRRIRLKPMT